MALPCEVPLQPGWEWTNWAMVRAAAAEIDELLQLKVVGSGHSPSDIACTDGFMISLEKYSKILQIDKESLLVTVEAGVTLNTLNEVLFDQGLAITVLGSISEQSVAGAMATGTHGTGTNFGILSTTVTCLRLITSEGKIINASDHENADIFRAAVCGLGALGIVSQLTFRVVPQFNLRSEETVMTLPAFIEQHSAIASSADHVRMHWFPHTDTVMVDRSFRVHEPAVPSKPSWFWNKFVNHHVLESLLFVSRFVTPLIPAINHIWASITKSHTPSVKVDRSYRMFNFDCLFKQYVNEWSIPVESFPAAITELKQWIDRNQYVHFPIEADDITLSPACGRASCFIGVIMYRPFGFPVPYKKYFEAFEVIMMKYQGRPHWAKVFLCPPSYLHAVYPKITEFIALCQRLDPAQRFWHPWHQRSLIY